MVREMWRTASSLELLPLLIAVHAGWRFRGLIGLGYLAMLTGFSPTNGGLPATIS